MIPVAPLGLDLPDAFIRRSSASLHNLLIIHRPDGALLPLRVTARHEAVQ